MKLLLFTLFLSALAGCITEPERKPGRVINVDCVRLPDTTDAQGLPIARWHCEVP